VLAPERNFFSASGGGVICPNCSRNEQLVRPISADAIKVMRFLLQNDFASASRLRVSPVLSRELEQLMRAYIRYILEREVKSAGFLDRLREELTL
jgi:DNA repair protein RecO (recombination protein O)